MCFLSGKSTSSRGLEIVFIQFGQRPIYETLSMLLAFCYSDLVAVLGITLLIQELIGHPPPNIEFRWFARQCRCHWLRSRSPCENLDLGPLFDHCESEISVSVRNSVNHNHVKLALVTSL